MALVADEQKTQKKTGNDSTKKADPKIAITKPTKAELKKKLTKDEYRVLVNKGTEWAGSGKYNKFYPKKGYFVCKACNNPLYSFKAKFNSGCGWPAFVCIIILYMCVILYIMYINIV